jgi:5-formyltetrahydrofolate cyclo-ligase
MTEKKLLRQRFRLLRDGVAQSDRGLWQAEIYARLFATEEWRQASLICGYSSVRGEIDLEPIRLAAYRAGKTYALPRTTGAPADRNMAFCPVAQSDILTPGSFGIPEPPSGCTPLPSTALDGALIIVPGLAFDREGYRIGYGGGYYDRLMADLCAEHIPVTTLGLAFSICVTDTLPHEAHDLPVSCIITERRVARTHG